MALMNMQLRSASLNMNTTVNVCFPEMTGFEKMKGQPYQYQPGVTYQTLWLFHGGGGDASDWIRKTSVERYADDNKLIVICPSTYNSFYTDMAYGERYYTWITKELPEIMHYLLPISEKREDTFVAGLSMGGYGALKWAMNEPERFACVGRFSGAVDMPNILKENHLHDGVLDRDLRIVFDTVERAEHTQEDALYMAEQDVKAGKTLPKVYLTCGTEDFTWRFNVHARDVFRNLGIDLTWDERPGNHNWDFWDKAIVRYLEWLPLRKTPIYAEEGK